MSISNIKKLVTGIFNILLIIIVYIMYGSSGSAIFLAAYITYNIFYKILMCFIEKNTAQMVSIRRNRGLYDNSKKVFRMNMIYSILIGIIGCLLFVFLGNNITKLLYKEILPGSVLVYFGLLFLLSSIFDCIKGYYTGCNNDTVVLISSSVQSVSMCIIAPIISRFFAQYGEKVGALLKNDLMKQAYGCMGIAVGMCISVLVGIITTFFGVRGSLSKKKYRSTEIKQESKRVFIKTTISNMLQSIRKELPLQFIIFIGTVLAFNTEIKNSGSIVEGYNAVGAILAEVIVFISLLDVILGNYINSIYIKMRNEYKNDEIKNMTVTINLFVRNVIFLIVPAFVSVIAYSGSIAEVVFKSSDKSNKSIIIFLSFVILFGAIAMCFEAIINAANYVFYSNIGLGIGFGSAIILLLAMNVGGYVSFKMLTVSLMIFFLGMAVVYGLVIFREINIRTNDLIIKIIKVAISGCIMLAIDGILAHFLHMNLIILVISYLVGYVLYIISILSLRSITSKEIKLLNGTIIYFPLNFFSNMLGLR